MLYLLYGTEKFLIEKEVNNIIKNNNIEKINIVKYNLESVLLNEIIEDAQTISLFDNKKLIIVENSYIFTRNTSKKLEQDSSLLEQYFKNINPDTIIIFISNNEKLDSVKKITKLIKDKGIVKEYNATNKLEDIVISMFDDYKINYKTAKFLIDRVGRNLDIIHQEIEKLKIYKIDDKIISEEDIESLTNKNIDIDIFKFIDNIISKRKKEALITYNELLKFDEEPIKIIIMLANKFRLMYQCSILAKKGYSDQAISEILKVHRYPVSLAIQAGLKYDSNLLLSYLNELANLDINIKTGKIEKGLSLELFILEL